MSEKEIKIEITKILVELGVPINLQGFTYFRECILEVVKDPFIMKKVTKELYPKVGLEFDVKGSVVERCMRHAAELAYDKTKFKCVKKMFNMSDEVNWNYKPTNSELIALIAEYLRISYDGIAVAADF